MWDSNEAAAPAVPTTLKSIDPANGETIWQGETTDPLKIDEIMKRASDVQWRWNLQGLAGRLEVMERFRMLVEGKRAELAKLISRETGKPLWDANTEVDAVLGKLKITADAYLKRTGKSRGELGGIQQEMRHRPHGVMAVFGPYNFPAHLPNGHIMPALIAGNTVVFKPSELTPAVGEWMVQQWQKAGIPEGVISLVQGGKDVGEALVNSPHVNGVLFTGSYATGKAIHQALSGRMEVMLALEMGGNNPIVVWDAKDPHAAVKLIIHSAYVSSGQRCTCARRLILPQGRDGDEIVKLLMEAIGKLRIGPYTDTPEPFMGPVISSKQASTIVKAEAGLVARGGKRLLVMKRPRGEDMPFLTPGLVDVTDAKNCPDEEYFGPLLQIIRVSDYEKALKEANRTQYGLAAGLISDSFGHWKLFHEHIRAGIINWNRPTTGASSAAPFGGIGHSGNLRPAAYYAADYCAYPVSTLAADAVSAPPDAPGMN